MKINIELELYEILINQDWIKLRDKFEYKMASPIMQQVWTSVGLVIHWQAIEDYR
tara:strand:+ start:4174 stop:4338 length:165 start_codon:yes stop_codon:yes gene_type:complete